MEKGFFHPDRGYWQTTSTPPASIVASYPEGTVEVPLKPGAGHSWDGSQWVAPTAQETQDAVRAQMRVYRRAFRLAARQTPDPADVAAHLLEAWDLMVAAEADPYGPLTMVSADVTIFERLHPDMAAFAQLLGLDDADLDALFTAAMALEAG